MDFNSTVKGSLLEGFYPEGWDFEKIDKCCANAPESVGERQDFWNKDFSPIECKDVAEFDVKMGHEIANEIRKANAEKRKIAFILHGGSGLSDDDFKNTIREGIAKVNIFTDLCLAGERAMKDGAEKKLGYLETRNLKVEYIKEAVKHKMSLFGSVNKA